MKKLLILLMAFSLFTACNNDKGRPTNDRDRTNTRDKDDYGNDDSKDKDKDDDRTKPDDDDRNKPEDDDRNKPEDDDRDDDSNSSSKWSSRDVKDFVSSCTSEAEKGGMGRSAASNYCECMQVKLEKLYPNPNDAGDIDINSSSMQKMVKDCLN